MDKLSKGGGVKTLDLVVVEVSQIQRYVFSANRLRENVGASYLVLQAADDWALEAVLAATGQYNNIVQRNENGKSAYELDDSKRIENDGSMEAEVLYTGGGNFVALFRESEKATQFIRSLSRRTLTDAPALQLVFARHAFEWTIGESLSRAVSAAFERLEANKRGWVHSAPLLGLGVTAVCSSTGLPAIKEYSIEDEKFLVGAEALAKLENVFKARERLQKIVPLPSGYTYPVENIDLLGRTRGEHSHVAVVHIDGNDMGKRKKSIGESYDDPSKNRGYTIAMRNFSRGIKKAADLALEKTINKLINRIENDTEHEGEKNGKFIVLYGKDNKNNVDYSNLITRIELAKKNDEDNLYYLPVLPIIYGGDDLTFVCDGRLGLSLAETYLSAFEEETEKNKDFNERITSSAGIAMVKSHYPFAQAYKLAEELCRSAKNYRRRAKADNTSDTSFMDWHFALSGFSGTLEEIRHREYQVREGSLTLRPVSLGENSSQPSYRSWLIVKKTVAAFQKEEWLQRRNKMKAFREALCGGKEEVKQFISKYGMGEKLPVIDESIEEFQLSGWHGGYCGYFDSLELADWFISLEEEGES